MDEHPLSESLDELVQKTKPSTFRRVLKNIGLGLGAIALSASLIGVPILYHKHLQNQNPCFTTPKHVIKRENKRYKHSFSPAEFYLEYEHSLNPTFDKNRIQNFFDNISNNVANSLMERQKTKSIDQAVEKLLQTPEGHQTIVLEIVKSLIKAEVIYHEEQFLSRSFDPKLHKGEFYHLDCDLLCHAFMHVARNLDLPLEEQQSLGHMYLFWNYDENTGWPLEATEFRKPKITEYHDKDGNLCTRIDFQTYELGDLFTTIEEIKSRYQEAYEGFSERAGYYRDMTDAEIRTHIKSNILGQLYDKSKDLEIVRLMEEADKEATVPQLKTNIYIAYTNQIFKTRDEGNIKEALEWAAKAKTFREKNSQFITSFYPDEFALIYK